jgi:hypothetical protein
MCMSDATEHALGPLVRLGPARYPGTLTRGVSPLCRSTEPGTVRPSMPSAEW